MKQPFVKWLIVLGTLVVATAGIGALLWFQGAELAARWVIGLGTLGTAGWLIQGLIYWRQVPWVRRLSAVLVSSILALGLAAVCWTIRWREGAFFLLSAWAMGMIFVIGLGLLRLALSPGFAVIGVARTLVDEAIRMKAALIFIVMVLLLLPMLPLIIASEEMLQYRLETFLTWSMIVVSTLLSLMTIFLAVGSVSGEFTQRQIFMTMTKPVGRGRYLLGKWLGIALLDLLLVIVSGAGIYGFAKMLDARPARDRTDRRAVEEQVLTARESVPPTPVSPGGLTDEIESRLERLREAEPGTYGRPGTPLSELPRQLQAQLRQQVMSEWYSLGPRDRKTFRFTELGGVSQTAQTVQFRLKPTAASPTPDGQIRLGVKVNGERLPSETGRRLWALANDRYHILEVPTSAIEEGRLDVELFNAAPNENIDPPSISFNLQDGVELLYQVGSFEANLLRSLGVLWVRLCFLGVLGIFASTFLGFPVASMLCALVYFAAAGHGYLTESFEYYAAFPKAELPLWERIIGVPALMWGHLAGGDPWEAFKVLIKLIGMGVTTFIPSFADYNPTPQFAHGRLVPWAMLGKAVLFVGVLWGGALCGGAWLIFRKKELARITA